VITFLRGKLVEKTPVSAIVDVGGIGYEAHIPLSTYETLPDDGEPVIILTRLVVREDSQQLYGFGTKEEREVFDLLLSVSGIGPRLALAVLSGMTVEDFGRAIRDRNDLALTMISGIGKKTAARMVLELAEKMGRLGLHVAARKGEAGVPGRNDDEVIAALISLGLTQNEAMAKLVKVRSKLGASASVEELIKAAIRF